jgi:hypothetical protein
MDINNLIKEAYPNCRIRVQNNLIFVRHDGKTYHYDKNTLEYLHSTNQLTIEYILKWKQQH